MRLRSFLWMAILALVTGLAGCDGSGKGSGSGGYIPPPVSQTIGSGGGEVVAGNATITVPGGALTQSALISIQPTNQYPADARLVAGTAYVFSSSSATAFTSPAQITIRYNAAALHAGQMESSLQLFQVAAGAWTPVSGGKVDTNNKIVTGTTTTLGTFAVLATIRTQGGGTGTGGTGGTSATTNLLFLSDNGVAGQINGSPILSLYASTLGGSSVQPITTSGSFGNEAIGHAAFSPDALTIVYDSQSAVGNLLVLARADGAAVQPLLTGGVVSGSGSAARPRAPAFSMDGSKIVFVYDQTGSAQIYTIAPDGTGLTQVTQNLNAQSVDNPAFTRAGSIRFVAKGTGSSLKYYLMNADGSNLTSTSTFSPSVAPWQTYSPDGSKIVYTAQASGKTDVFVMNADGSGATQITQLGASSIGNARFSADGGKLIFDAILTAGQTRSLYSINLDGTGQQTLSTPVTGNLTLQDAR